MQEDRNTTASGHANNNANKAQEAVAASMEAYLVEGATGASDEEAFAEEALAVRESATWIPLREPSESGCSGVSTASAYGYLRNACCLKTPKDEREPWKPQRISVPPGSCVGSVRAKTAGSSG